MSQIFQSVHSLPQIFRVWILRGVLWQNASLIGWLRKIQVYKTTLFTLIPSSLKLAVLGVCNPPSTSPNLPTPYPRTKCSRKKMTSWDQLLQWETPPLWASCVLINLTRMVPTKLSCLGLQLSTSGILTLRDVSVMVYFSNSLIFPCRHISIPQLLNPGYPEVSNFSSYSGPRQPAALGATRIRLSPEPSETDRVTQPYWNYYLIGLL